MHTTEEMQPETENGVARRFDPRYPTKAYVSCHRYASSDSSPASDGVMRNVSNDGFYIETNRKYDAGSVLIVRMLRYPPLGPPRTDRPSLRTICLAEVKWQQELSDASVVRYGLGMRYLK